MRTQIAWTAVLLLVIAVMIVRIAWAGPIECSSQRHHVWVTDVHACVPENAVWPAQERTGP